MGSVCAVIVAGGVGSRFGNPGGKLLVDVAGKPLMTWSLLAFDAVESVGHIVVVCPSDRVDEMRRLAIDPFDIQTPVSFACAGAERQDSTYAGICAVPEGFDVVAIHDSARPLIRPETIEAAIAVLQEDVSLDGTVCAQPSVDTLKIVDGGGVIEDTPDRSRYWCVQTPQVFRIDAVLRAHERSREEGFVGTDDASLVERMGGAVKCVESPRDNMKVTLPEDLLVVRTIMESRL